MKIPRQYEQRHRNGIHSFLLVVGLLGLLCVMGLSVAGTDGIIWAGGMGVFLVAVGPKASPRLVLRMFKARPLTRDDAPLVYQLLDSLTDKAQLHCQLQLFRIPSQGMNAFSVGDCREAVIALTDGLLRQLHTEELAAVMAHEICHIRNNDMQVMTLADLISRLTHLFSSLGMLLLFFSLPMLLFGRAVLSFPFVLLLVFAPLLGNMLQLALSRTREYLADLDAVALTGDPLSLILALEKMDSGQMGRAGHFLFQGRDKLLPSLFRSHPATATRIQRLEVIFGEQRRPHSSDAKDRHGISIRPRPAGGPRRHIKGLWS